MTSENNILPKLGHVKKTCQQWGVREDGALAQRLQSQEINEYYNRNKERNAIVREDFPKALTEQKKEEAQRALEKLCDQEQKDGVLSRMIDVVVVIGRKTT